MNLPHPSGPTVTVLELRRANEGNLKAFCSVKLDCGLTICAVRVIQQPGQRAFVSGPQQKGEKGNWHPLVKLGSELRGIIETVVLQQCREKGLIE